MMEGLLWVRKVSVKEWKINEIISSLESRPAGLKT